MERAGRVRIARALLSVADRGGLTEFAGALAGRGAELLSTGGTARALRDEGFAVRDVEEVTAMPEMLDGRIKSLHPAIHGGLLADLERPEHRSSLEFLGWPVIDLVAVNFYPFERVRGGGGGESACIEAIDIGGPAMLRAAAKNSVRVTPVASPADYAETIEQLERNDGCTTLEFRRRMAAKAFATTAAYDAAVADWTARWEPDSAAGPTRGLGRTTALPQGENPHQRGWLHYAEDGGVAGAERLAGPELSYNNYLDADCAWQAARDILGDASASCVIVKHGTPCGGAAAACAEEAYRRALAADAESAFGGVAGFGGSVDLAAARAMADRFLSLVVAPGFTGEALAALAARPSLRLLRVSRERVASPTLLRSVGGGVLEQTPDLRGADGMDLRTVSRRQPEAGELDSLEFAWRLVRHARSNAIVLARGAAAVGVGSGQTSRVEALRGAVGRMRAGGGAGEGLCMASDGFLPFADSVLLAAEAGVRAVVQPGGSKRDGEVIEAADAAGVAMMFTGTRHFRH